MEMLTCRAEHSKQETLVPAVLTVLLPASCTHPTVTTCLLRTAPLSAIPA